LGLVVQVATSGEAACEALATSHVDLVLMDLRMPGMSGQTLFHSIVARWPHLVTRVIVMTGDPEAQDHHDWLRHNDLPVLTKPFELAQLEQLVSAMATEERRQSQG
jgi:CheY-like chemotaxis protein